MAGTSGGGAGGPSSQHLLVALRLYVCRNLSSDANRYGPMCQGVPASRCVLTVTRNKQVTLSGRHLIRHQKREKTPTDVSLNVPVRRLGSFGHPGAF